MIFSTHPLTEPCLHLDEKRAQLRVCPLDAKQPRVEPFQKTVRLSSDKWKSTSASHPVPLLVLASLPPLACPWIHCSHSCLWILNTVINVETSAGNKCFKGDTLDNSNVPSFHFFKYLLLASRFKTGLSLKFSMKCMFETMRHLIWGQPGLLGSQLHPGLPKVSEIPHCALWDFCHPSGSRRALRNRCRKLWRNGLQDPNRQPLTTFSFVLQTKT